MNDQQLDQAVALALDPNEGTPFKFGGRDFRFQFLTADGEERLVRLLMPRIKGLLDAGAATQQQVMQAINDLLPEAVGIILGDYTYEGADGAGYVAHVDATIAWARKARGAGIRLTMYRLVHHQFEVNELGKLLAGLLQSDALLQAVDALPA